MPYPPPEYCPWCGERELKRFEDEVETEYFVEAVQTVLVEGVEQEEEEHVGIFDCFECKFCGELCLVEPRD